MEIDIDLSSEQTKAWELLEDDRTKSLILYGGQAGGGKSFLICLWQIYRRLTYPDTRGYIARESGLKDIEESVMVTFWDVVKFLNVSDFIKYNAQKHHITFTNGSTISLIDAFYYPRDPNFHRFGSKEYTDGCIEEGATISKKAAQILLSRTRYKHDIYGLSKKQLITCNPDEGWIKDEIAVPYFEGSLKGNRAFIPATLESNPNKEFVKEYTATLQEMDDYDRARLLHGDWFAQPRTGGEFYMKFDEKINTKELAYDPDEPLHLSFDFNVNPYMTCTVWQMNENMAMQIDEICTPSPKNTTADNCKEFINRYRDHQAGVFIYGDPAGRHQDTRTERGWNDFRIIENELKDYHPISRVQSRAPSVVMRGNFINAIFADKIPDACMLISTNCNLSISDLNFVKVAPDGTKAKIRTKNPSTGVTYERWGHTSDAMDYFILTIFANQYQAFKSGGMKPIYKLGKRKTSSAY